MSDDRRADVLGLCLEVGEVLVANGVPADETISAVERVSRGLTGRTAEVSVLLTTITVCDPGGEGELPLTTMHVVKGGAPTLHRLAEVERLVTDVEAGRVDIDGARESLRRAEASRGPYPWVLAFLAQGVTVAAWTVTLGGGPVAVAVGVGAALVIRPLADLIERSRVPVAFAAFLAAFLAAAIPLLLLWAGLSFESGSVIVAGLFPFLPGAALVSSVLDGISGSPFTSMARGLSAAVTAVALAVGVLVAVRLALELDIPAGSAPQTYSVLVGGITTAVAMASLGIARQQPARLLPATMALGVIAWYVAVGGRGPDGVTTALVFVAAALVGAGGQLAARAQHTVATVYTGIAVLPLVPGRALYGAMLAFAIGQNEAGAESLLDAVFVSVAIAAGVALGLAVMQRVPGPRRVVTWVGRAPWSR